MRGFFAVQWPAAPVTGGGAATFAGGSFWSVESEVEAIRGAEAFRGPDGHAWGG